MVSKLIKNGTNIMFQRQTTILSAAGIMMLLTLGSAFLGVYKLHLLSGLDIATNRDALDAFRAAFRIPDLVFQVVIAGALNAAFIPVFGEMMSHRHTEDAWRLMSNLINLCITIFALIAIVIFFLAEPFTRYLVIPGSDIETVRLTANLTRLMMLSPILLGISAFFSGSLQVQHRFLIPAIAPILYNLGLILGIATFYPHTILGIQLPGFGVWGLAYGVLLGSVAHLLSQIPLVYHVGFNYSAIWDWKNKAVQQVTKLMLPRTIGISIDQLEAQVATMLVSTLGRGSVFLLGQVFSLVTFPISFFGVSIAQAAFPTLSKEAVEDKDAFRTTLLTTFHQILYLIVPVAVLLTVLKLPAVRVLLNSPDWTRTLEAAQVLFYFAPLLVAQSAIHLWARAFYALKDSVAPLTAAAAGVIVSVFISILTLPVLGMRGLGLGMSIGSFVTLGTLMYLMQKRIGGFSWGNFIVPTARILLAGAIMAIAVYLPIKPIESLFLDTTTTLNLILLSILVSWFGLSLYLLISWLLGSQEIIMFIRLAHKLRSWREAFVKLPAAYQQGIAGDITSES